MDFGGIIAGAMAGGGQAIQQNAQSQLEQQREKALAQLEQKMARQNLDYQADINAQQAETEQQYQMDAIEARGEQSRLTQEQQAKLTDQYGGGGDMPAKVREIAFLTQNVTGGDQERAAQIAYNRNSDFSRSDAYQMVVDSLENMGLSQRANMTEEDLLNRANALYENLSAFDAQGNGGNRRATQSDRFSFQNGNTLTQTPSGGMAELPNPMADPSIFQSK